MIPGTLQVFCVGLSPLISPSKCPLFRAFSLSLSICSTFYEDWSFVMDEEKSSMLPTMAAGKPGQGQGRWVFRSVASREGCLGVNL